jgi:hypothetical protein
MDENGQVYFGTEDEIPESDKNRLTDAHAAFLLRTVKKDFENRVELIRKQEAANKKPYGTSER